MNSSINIDGHYLPEGFDRFWHDRKKSLGGNKVKWLCSLADKEIERIKLQEKVEANR